MSLPSSTALKYRPDIDGLRAVAVLAVVLNHAGLGAEGGYVGVDVFFVISGYLITELILKDLDAGCFRLAGFWERRVRRIVPALVVMVAATLVAGWFRLLPLDLRDLGRSVVAQSVMLSNVYFYTVSGYFEQAAAQKPLLHTWSLAVEEQFYVFFPLLLLAVHRWCGRWRMAVLLTCTSASFALSVWGSVTHAWASFYLLPTRAWELLLGTLIAAMSSGKRPSRIVSEGMALVGLLAILSAVCWFDSETPVPGIPALLPCGGAALIIAAGRGAVVLPAAGRMLAFGPLKFIGLISYSLYLWHWPLLVLAQYQRLIPLSLEQRWQLVLASVALAVISWRWVETPLRRKVVLDARRSLFAVACAAMGLILCAGVALSWLKGVPSRLPPAAQRLAEGSEDFRYEKGIGLQEVLEERFFELGVRNAGKPVHVMVWGDSHALAIMPAIDHLCRENGVRGLGAAHAATVPLIGYKNRHLDSLRNDNQPFNEAVIRYVNRNHVRHLIMIARWDGYLSDDHGDPAPLRDGVVTTLHALRDSGAKIWLMLAVPVYNRSMPQALASSAIRGQDPNSLALSVDDYRRFNQPQRAFLEQALQQARVSGASLLDPEPLMTGKDGRCLVTTSGFSVYRDHHHLSVRGAMHLSPLFAPLFDDVADASPAQAPQR